MASTKSTHQPRRRKRALILSGGGARGAYQAGVWKYLLEKKWKPDLVCGTSVGAINASAIGCRLNLDEIMQIWQTIERRKIYKISLWKQFTYAIRRKYAPMMDTEPFRRLLEEKIDVHALRNNPQEIIITAVNLYKSQLRFFNNDEINVEHVMASSAIPILFPWVYVDGVPYWDGGIMANTPILPALQRGAKEIIVVLLSPVGGAPMPVPRNRLQAAERVFELGQIGSYEAFMAHLAWEHKVRKQSGPLRNLLRRTLTLGDVKITTVAPDRMLGFYSILNFSQRQSGMLISEGYTDARNQLRDLFDDED